MDMTTIQINKHVKEYLDEFKEYSRESYNQVIIKIVNLFKKMKKQPELTKQVLLDIEESRKQFERGEFCDLEEIEKRLGLL